MIGQKKALNQRSCIILEVQIKIFCTHAAKFSFSKIPVDLNINIFCENGHEAFFNIKEQMQKNKFKIQNNMCASVVFKAKTKEKFEEIFFSRFFYKTHNRDFLGVNQFFLNFCLTVLALKTIDIYCKCCFSQYFF